MLAAFLLAEPAFDLWQWSRSRNPSCTVRLPLGGALLALILITGGRHG